MKKMRNKFKTFSVILIIAILFAVGVSLLHIETRVNNIDGYIKLYEHEDRLYVRSTLSREVIIEDLGSDYEVLYTTVYFHDGEIFELLNYDTKTKIYYVRGSYYIKINSIKNDEIEFYE